MDMGRLSDPGDWVRMSWANPRESGILLGIYDLIATSIAIPFDSLDGRVQDGRPGMTMIENALPMVRSLEAALEIGRISVPGGVDSHGMKMADEFTQLSGKIVSELKDDPLHAASLGVDELVRGIKTYMQDGGNSDGVFSSIDDAYTATNLLRKSMEVDIPRRIEVSIAEPWSPPPPPPTISEVMAEGHRV
jgi:hypothetical protein